MARRSTWSESPHTLWPLSESGSGPGGAMNPALRPGLVKRMKCLRPDLSFEIGFERVHFVLGDHDGWHDDEAIRRNLRLVAFEIGGHQLHALIAPLVRLLHDR